IAPLLQRRAIEQFALRPVRLPLIEGVVALRITIYQNHFSMVGIDPIDRAAPDILAQLHQFPGLQIRLERNMHLLGARLRIEVRQVALRVTLKTADSIAIKGCSKSRLRDATLEWNKHGLIVLVSIPVKHQ